LINNLHNLYVYYQLQEINMQDRDYDFIKRYKEKQFGIAQSVPQKAPQEAPQKAIQEAPQEVAKKKFKDVVQEAPQKAPQEAPQEATQEAPQEATQKDVQKAPQEATQKDVQKAPQEATQKDVQEVFQEVCQSLSSVSKTEDNTKQNALRIIKNALEQIQIALLLLEETDEKKCSVLSVVLEEQNADSSAFVVEESVVPQEQSIESASNLEESVVPQEQSIEPASNVKKTVVMVPQKVETIHADHISDVEADEEDNFPKKIQEEEFPKKIQEEEFKIIMPKKSKNKTPAAIDKPKKDDFPSLGSSFTPVKKTGFWGSGKDCIEIAKSIAHIPSPKPIRVSSPSLTKKSRSVERGGENYSSDDELSSEFHIQKSKDKDDDFWQ
jgi:hypothetical protein